MAKDIKERLIDAAYNKDIPRLISLIEGEALDLSSDEFNILVPHRKTIQIHVLRKGVISDKLLGHVSPNYIGGYSIIPQTFQGDKGTLLTDRNGDWTFSILNDVLLEKIRAGIGVVINETFTICYQKYFIASNIANEIICYISAFGDEIDIKKVLDAGCCPNFSIKEYVIALSEGKRIDSDENDGGSLPLLNAIRRNSSKIVETLINHSCPCCGGRGAKITEKILSYAQKNAIVYKMLIDKLKGE